jgi:hypothetical protein
MRNLVCSNYEVLTVTNAIKTLTATKLVPASGRFADQLAEQVFLSVETDAIRYTLDSGTTVSATVGVPLAVGDTIELTGNTFRDFTCFRVTGDAKLHVHYFHAV